MATIKVKVLTKMHVKRRRSGLQCYSCSAISSESSICSITIWNDEQLKNLVVVQYMIIRDCQIYQKDKTDIQFLSVNIDILRQSLKIYVII